MCMYVCRHACVYVLMGSRLAEPFRPGSVACSWDKRSLTLDGVEHTRKRARDRVEVTLWLCLHIPSSSWRGERER